MSEQNCLKNVLQLKQAFCDVIIVTSFNILEIFQKGSWTCSGEKVRNQSKNQCSDQNSTRIYKPGDGLRGIPTFLLILGNIVTLASIPAFMSLFQVTIMVTNSQNSFLTHNLFKLSAWRCMDKSKK